MTAFVFDVDGTLTPSRSKMDPAFQEWFLGFQATHETYLVTGSDYDKTVEQVGWKVVDRAKMMFNCCGNEIRKGTDLIYQSEWKPEMALLTELESLLTQSKFKLRTGNHVEIRTGSTNFSVIGRNCDREQRQQYIDYDLKSGERESLAIRLSATFPELEFAVAGETGIDIYPRGRSKQQLAQQLAAQAPLHFFGDRMDPAGNDHGLATAIREQDLGVAYHVRDWQDTWEKLVDLIGEKS